MTHSLLLLVLNGYLATLAACALIIFVHYLYKNYHEGYVQMRPAIALTVLWIGDFVLRAPLFWVRAHIEAGYLRHPPNLALILGGFISIVAFLCVIRVFSPMHWGNKSWVAALILSTAVVLGSLDLIFY